MVIFFEWHRTSVDQKSNSGLPMTGEGTGLGALASPLAGYLGKVQERAASQKDCPWCTSKGLNYALHSYRINLQESITLCTNPECLFPLVSRSLQDVLASLDHAESTTGSKRKKPLELAEEELMNQSPKRLRSNEVGGFVAQSVGDISTHQEEHCAGNTVNNGQHVTSNTDGEKVIGHLLNSVCSSAVTTGVGSLQDNDTAKPESPAFTEDCSPPAKSTSTEQLQILSEVLVTVDVDKLMFASHCAAPGTLETEDACKDIFSGNLETCDLSCNQSSELEGLVPVPTQLFWWNSDNLCWLDSLLIALVNCKSLGKSKPKEEPKQSFVWQLMKGYEGIYKTIQSHQQTGRDGIARVQSHVLQKANTDLQNLRMSVFKQLEPKLHCQLGQRETPVFAMPLLLMKDSWVEPVFQSTFYWEFKCSECNTTTTERVAKTLPTFTNIVPEWHPLHATHIAPCNKCNRKNQRRTMVLERVPPVFVLHFVEGLPDNDIKIYSFNFNGKRYSVSTVIQYKPQHKHFVTWVCNSDGSWLEFDDLKHPHCKTHRKLPVPAQEMHVVFWEVEEDVESFACSPSSTCVNTPPTKNEIHPSLSEKDVLVDELMTCSPHQSLVTAHNDTDIFSALSACDDDSAIMDTTVAAGVDASIGSTTLLDTFEGLSHNDIITLTLVELKPDSETQLLNDSGGTQGLIEPNRNKMLEATPDSSSAVIGSEMCQGPDAEIILSASDPESVDNSSSDPTFVPFARRAGGRGSAKGKAVIKPKEKKAPASKKAAQISPPASSEQTNVICNEPVCPDTLRNMPLVETPKAASPISSTEASPLPSHNNPTKPTVLDQNARWSFLLSKHPMNDLHKSNATVPSTHTPTPPMHSTPNPVQRLQPRATIHKPQLRMEENVGLPLKAAEMYVAFGRKSLDSQRSLPTPAPAPTTAHAKLMQPVLPQHQKSLMNTTVLSDTSRCLTEVKGNPEISTLKKRSSQSSKVPSGLSQTEALRYKLIKKLKAKKKALAKLNKMLGQEVSLRPDSTNLSSPNTVTSSTYDGSTCEDFLSDLLSPATTASSLSPDSSGLQEILASGQAVLDQLDCGISAAVAESHTDTSALGPTPENFLDEFLSQTVVDGTAEMQREALSALEMFM